ncbi:MAG: carboxypeptidase-like regulatory domain-containing protein [Candidatus Thorarchaeota archaeon]
MKKNPYSFSGYVKSDSHKPIVNAIVEVITGEFNSDKNSKRTTKTDENGYFKLRISTDARKPRFVLNIMKEGYGLFSKVFFRAKQNRTWLLTKGTIHKIDPTIDNTIQDTPEVSKRQLLRTKKTEAIKKLSNQRLQEKRDKGIKFTINKNTLVDTEGKAPEGLVNVTLATVDILGIDSMPGDFTAAFKDEKGEDQIGYMITYGAGSVDVLANGKRYHLKPGSKAKIEIPLPKHLEGSKSIPKTIPFLEYNREKGIWEEVGEGVFNGKTQVYTATTTHFSTFNMDILKTDQACLVVDGKGIKKAYRLKVMFELPPNTPRSRWKNPNANDKYALYNLAPDIDYTLIAYKSLDDIEIDKKTCTPGLQNPSIPLEPAEGDPADPNFPTFPACNCVPNPVFLSAARPETPTRLDLDGLDAVACGYINLIWEGSATGSEEGYIIRVYQDAGDPGVNPPIFEYSASSGDNQFKVEGRQLPDGTMEGLTPYTTYYIQIHQYDEYAELDSLPCPDPPLEVRTLNGDDFFIENQICGDTITQVRFNGNNIDQPLPGSGFGYGVQHRYVVCQIPDSIQVTTGQYFFDIPVNAEHYINIRALKKMLPGTRWRFEQTVPPYSILTLHFLDDVSFEYSDDSGRRTGTYDESSQDCHNNIIKFILKFQDPDYYETECNFKFTDPRSILVKSLPTDIPTIDATFTPE